MMGSSTPVFQWQETLAVPPFPAGRISLRALLRADFVELYAGEHLVQTLRLRRDERFTGSVGLWLDRCSARLEHVRAWKLALSSQILSERSAE